MTELAFDARRLYVREIFTLLLLSALLAPVSFIANGALSSVFVVSTLVCFGGAVVLMALATYWTRPLYIDAQGIRFGHSVYPLSEITGIEFRQARSWMIISLKSSILPRTRLVKIMEQSCDGHVHRQLKMWSHHHRVVFNDF